MNEPAGLADPRLLGLEFEVVRHGPVSSLEEAAAARRVEPSQVIKTMVVRRGEGDHLFVLVPGDRVISWPKLRRLLDVNRLSLPDEEHALEVTGYRRGTITPLGSRLALPVIADAEVKGRVSLGAGAHGVSINVMAGDLVKMLDAQVGDVTEPAV